MRGAWVHNYVVHPTTMPRMAASKRDDYASVHHLQL
jgi:hypothetical protein